MAKPRTPKKNTPTSETINPIAVPSMVVEKAAPVADPVQPLQADSEAKTTAARKITKKPEIVKTDARANVVPINLDEEIRRLAYLYAERRGFTPGHEADDWLAAEQEVRQRYHQQSA
jgi:hypothetical protein